MEQAHSSQRWKLVEKFNENWLEYRELSTGTASMQHLIAFKNSGMSISLLSNTVLPGAFNSTGRRSISLLSKTVALKSDSPFIIIAALIKTSF